jgi:4-carboxymuconolactone decarboxylase
MDDEQRAEQGTRIRSEVLGADHVARRQAEASPFTEPFQDLITRYAWGEIWARPGLDARSRSMITLALLTALGQDHELALHVRGAKRNGLSDNEVQEVLLHCAIYAGVPAANRAIAVAQGVLDAMAAEELGSE